MQFRAVLIQFQVLSELSDLFVALKHKDTLFEARLLFLESDSVNGTAKHRSPERDEAIRIL